MADGKPIEQKVYEVLNADSTLTALLALDGNGTPALYVGHASPLVVRYPSINFDWKEYASEEKLPAGHGVLCFIISQEKDSLEKYSKFVAIRDRLLVLLNRNEAEPLTEVNMIGNEGLRVVRILRTMSEFSYREAVDKHHSSVMFTVVKSEQEDFSLDFTGWN